MTNAKNNTSKKLGIDLRFYRPEPYGLAVHIRDLMVALLPLLQSSTKISKTVLIFDARIQSIDLTLYLPWWEFINNSDSFEIYFSSAKYYSLSEQTTFLLEINKLNCDLMYFFTFNYPLLYNKPYIYQVLDLSIPKTRSHVSFKVQAMLLCFRSGIRHSKHVFFLGQNALADSEQFSNFNFTDPKKDNFKANTVIYNGINESYLKILSASKEKSQNCNLKYSESKAQELQSLKQEMGLTKPYFFFISVWRKYKNIERLAEAFNDFNIGHNEAYQLVLGGGQDEKYPEILENIKKLQQYKKGNIIVTGRINNDEDVVLLYDGAEALVAPSLSEGFGLWMVEATSRGLPIIASDIPIFHEIADGKIPYFDPLSTKDIAQKMDDFVRLPQVTKDKIARDLLMYTAKFRWENTAETIINKIELYL